MLGNIYWNGLAEFKHVPAAQKKKEVPKLLSAQTLKAEVNNP